MLKFKEEGKLEEAENCFQIKAHLKRELDMAITEMADMLYYRPLKESVDYEPRQFIEGKNTISEAVDELSKRVAEDEPHQEIEDEIEVDLQHVAKEARYRILR
jgi:hypothetical protein